MKLSTMKSSKETCQAQVWGEGETLGGENRYANSEAAGLLEKHQGASVAERGWAVSLEMVGAATRGQIEGCCNSLI